MASTTPALATAGVIQRQAEQTETVIDAIGLFHDQDEVPGFSTGRHELADLTERDGAASHTYLPKTSRRSSPSPVDLAHQIRRHACTIAHAPTNQALDGSYRGIRATVSGPDRYTVRTRAG